MQLGRTASGTLDQARAPLEAQSKVNDYFASVASYWEHIYQQTTLDARIYQDRLVIALQSIERLGLPRTAHLLEVGCGAGLCTKALAMRGYRVDALDSVPTMLKLTRLHLLEAGINDRMRTICAEVQQLPLADNSFDLVFALGVLPWLDKPCVALREMARVTRPGGYVLVTGDNRWKLSEALDPWKMRMLRPIIRSVAFVLRGVKLLPPRASCTQPQNHRHSRRELDSFLLEAGLDKLSELTFGFGPFTFFGKQFVPDRIGIKVHQLFQTAANRKLPIVAVGGGQYLAVATKRL